MTARLLDALCARTRLAQGAADRPLRSIALARWLSYRWLGTARCTCSSTAPSPCKAPNWVGHLTVNWLTSTNWSTHSANCNCWMVNILVSGVRCPVNWQLRVHRGERVSQLRATSRLVALSPCATGRPSRSRAIVCTWKARDALASLDPFCRLLGYT
eukprot:5516670-Prymnesium_polylepis.1